VQGMTMKMAATHMGSRAFRMPRMWNRSESSMVVEVEGLLPEGKDYHGGTSI